MLFAGLQRAALFAWMKKADPSWYTAVPTMHQTILSRAGRDAGIIESGRLRFVRWSSSSLAPQVMAELEDPFGCPVIEAYGMTEAAHQMASYPLADAPRANPAASALPPGRRLPAWTKPAPSWAAERS